MSILDTVRAHGRHRGKTPAQLRRELDKALCELSAMATRIGELTAERDQLEGHLDEAGIELSGVHVDLAAQAAELLELRAFKANILAIDAPSGTRDIDDGDAPTHPTGIHVQPLWDALGQRESA